MRFRPVPRPFTVTKLFIMHTCMLAQTYRSDLGIDIGPISEIVRLISPDIADIGPILCLH